MKKYNIILLLLLALSTFLSAQNPVVIDTNTIHGLRELGKKGGTAYEENNHTGIENEEIKQLEQAATDLKKLIPESVAPNFKVFDYGSYPILKFMNKANFSDELFASMEDEVKKVTSNYLLIGKYIDPKTGKVEFKVKLSLPVKGNKSSANNDSIPVVGKKTPCNGLNYMSLYDLEILNDELNQIYKNNNIEKGQAYTSTNIVETKSLKETVQVTREIAERCFLWSNFYLMPSGDLIKIQCRTIIPPIFDANRTLYGWYTNEGGKEILYQAHIDFNKQEFYGYRKNIKEANGFYSPTNEYYQELSSFASAYTTAGNYPVLYVESSEQDCSVNVYSQTKNFPNRTELLRKEGVVWKLTNITTLNNIVFTADETKAINLINSTCLGLTTIGLKIYNLISQRLQNTSPELRQSAKLFAASVSQDKYAIGNFFTNGEFRTINANGVNASIFNLYFFGNKQLIDKTAIDNALGKQWNHFYNLFSLQEAFQDKNYNNIVKITKENYTCNVDGAKLLLPAVFFSIPYNQKIDFIKEYNKRDVVKGGARELDMSLSTFLEAAVYTAGTNGLAFEYTFFGTVAPKGNSETQILENSILGGCIGTLTPTENTPFLNEMRKDNNMTNLMIKGEKVGSDFIYKIVRLMTRVWSKDNTEYNIGSQWANLSTELQQQYNPIGKIIEQKKIFYYHSGWFDINTESLSKKGTIEFQNGSFEIKKILKSENCTSSLPSAVTFSIPIITNDYWLNTFFSKEQLCITIASKFNTVCNPFDLIMFVPAENFTHEAYNFEKNQPVFLPAMAVYLIFSKHTKEAKEEAIEFALEATGYAVGIGELASAIRTARYAKAGLALLDLGIQLPGSLVKHTELGKDFAKRHPLFMPLYTCVTIAYIGGRLSYGSFKSEIDDLEKQADDILKDAQATEVEKEIATQTKNTLAACKNGACFIPNTPIFDTKLNTFKPIKKAELGDKIACNTKVTQGKYATIAKNNKITYLALDNEINPDPYTSADQKALDKLDYTKLEMQKVTLNMPKANGTVSEIQLLRPTAWLERNDIAEKGKNTYLNLPEMGLEGYATVTDLAHFRVTKSNTASDDEWSSGLVTGVFKHIANGVYHLRYDNGDSLGVTGTHPLYSLDRQQFIPTEDIKVGEHLLSKSGVITVVSKTYDPTPQEVYNLEVGHWHTFLVGVSGVVAHNSYWDCFKKLIGEKIDIECLWATEFNFNKLMAAGKREQSAIAKFEKLAEGEKDIVLGLNEPDGFLALGEFRDANLSKASTYNEFAKNGFSNTSMGAISQPERIANEVTQAMTRCREAGGKIHFRLDGGTTGNWKEGLKGSAGKILHAKDYTNFELRNIVRNKDWLENTIFYKTFTDASGKVTVKQFTLANNSGTLASHGIVPLY